MPTVPNIVGLDVTAAKTARNAAGFSAGTFGVVYTSPYHVTHSQVPAAGSTAAAGTPVDTVYAYTSLKDATNNMQNDGMIWGS